MKKEYPCPECNYPMRIELIKKGGYYRRRKERYVCDSCKHTGLVRTASEINNDLNYGENK